MSEERSDPTGCYAALSELGEVLLVGVVPYLSTETVNIVARRVTALVHAVDKLHEDRGQLVAYIAEHSTLTKG